MTNNLSHKFLPVAIIGGGFSGTLLAVNLRRYGVPVTLIERHDAQVAKGVAFGTQSPEHLLNVRASNMSAFPDDAGHFLKWMQFTEPEEANRFVPRQVYGAYVRELLTDALAAGQCKAIGEHGGLRIVTGEAQSVDFGADRARVHIDDGKVIECRCVVLALGNFPPVPHAVLQGLGVALYCPDPWDADAMQDLAGLDHVLVVGSGLTAADVVLSLESKGFQGKITVMSRRGLKPLSHAQSGPVVPTISEPEQRGVALVCAVREHAQKVGWRAAVDALRPHTQNLWRRHSVAKQASFLRHMRPFWDIHRHRLAPSVAQRLSELEAAGRLHYVAGKLTAAQVAEGRALVTYRPRGTRTRAVLDVARVFNCAGPDCDLRRVRDPLVQNLLAQGKVRSDVHGLGLDVDHLGRVRDAAGHVQSGLLAVGPITKGEAWEIIAVPDIRKQVWGLARYLSDEHWVGGEGL